MFGRFAKNELMGLFAQYKLFEVFEFEKQFERPCR